MLGLTHLGAEGAFVVVGDGGLRIGRVFGGPPRGAGGLGPAGGWWQVPLGDVIRDLRGPGAQGRRDGLGLRGGRGGEMLQTYYYTDAVTALGASACTLQLFLM